MLYEKTDKDAGRIRYAEVVEKLGPICSFKGRLVLHHGGLFNLIRKAHTVRAVEPSLSHGSDNTKKKGIEVGYLELVMSADWQDSVCFYYMPGLISSGHTYQPNSEVETFDPQATHWNGDRVARIHRVKIATDKSGAAKAGGQ